MAFFEIQTIAKTRPLHLIALMSLNSENVIYCIYINLFALFFFAMLVEHKMNCEFSVGKKSF